MKKGMKRLGAVLLAAALLLSATAAAQPDAQDASGQAEEAATQPAPADDYAAYFDRVQNAPRPDAVWDARLADYRAEPAEHAAWEAADYSEGAPCLVTTDQGRVEIPVQVGETGLYRIEVEYYPVEGKGSSIVRSLTVDGQLPFDNARSLAFTRVFCNDGPILTLENGNQARPAQVESPRWLTVSLQDPLGYTSEPFAFHFTAGSHWLGLEAVREPMAIRAVRLVPVTDTPTREDMDSANAGRPATTDQYRKIQAEGEGEAVIYKSDSMIYPVYDTSSPATQPSSEKNILLNIMGGTRWQTCGQWIEWTFTVPETGLYHLGFKARQNAMPGQPSYRRIYVDGQVPCEEMNAVAFPYDTAWNNVVVGGEEPITLYLEAGETHTLRMENTLGGLASLARRVSTVIDSLNDIYRSFLIVIGQDADQNRDYQFETAMADEIARMRELGGTLDTLYDEYVALGGMGGSQAQILRNMADQLRDMSSDPSVIAREFSEFSNNISNLGTWLTNAQTQPLELDYFVLYSPDRTMERAESGFFSSLWFAIRQFFASFTADYDTVASAGGSADAVTVWISTGRDQANALSQLIDNTFSPYHDTPVNLQLTPAGALLMATLAGIGPDVALSMAQSEQMNFALRGAGEDLSGYPGFDEVKARFHESALVPLTLDGKVYGLPETQAFPMLFYRTDILEELELDVPQTWDDVIAMLPVLQKKNLNFGLPAPISTTGSGVGLPVYAMFLYQNGGEFYSADAQRSLLDSDAAIDAFYTWTRLYTDYTLPREYDFNTRFRAGTIPIGVADYGTFNALSVFAPELAGVWEFAPVPGVRKADGSIDRSVAGTVTASVMLSTAGNKEGAWEFLKWWTSADTQAAYGRELESILGSAARYQTANQEALYQIPWGADDFDTMMEQWQWVRGVPEVPGSYMTPRYIDFAFKQVVLSNAGEPAKVLQQQTRLINAEITKKRKEFGLPYTEEGGNNS